ncbi:uncharacterized protein G2W53_018072 [Senna tora]|uniref:Uncharacterized protein n=1 Tax=Senna tora TaxID=362788 RepID=A0A834WN10_9FABA|nr:uncharacterized protein G2W53_018072 [Senna tora]
MRDSIPLGKKKAIVTMLDINPGKSLHIVMGNQSKQKGSCLSRATLALNLTDKIGYYIYA